MTRLTELAQQKIAAVLNDGDTAVDATAGNGLDTLFLAECVGLHGRVFAFDVQADAITSTRGRLERAGIQNVQLTQRSHAELKAALPADVLGHVRAIMFNLGYLPGGDHCVVTDTSSTLTALNAALDVLGDSGMLTIVAYPGHAGGDAEARAVADWLMSLDTSDVAVERVDGNSGRNVSPILFIATKQKHGLQR